MPSPGLVSSFKGKTVGRLLNHIQTEAKRQMGLFHRNATFLRKESVVAVPFH